VILSSFCLLLQIFQATDEQVANESCAQEDLAPVEERQVDFEWAWCFVEQQHESQVTSRGQQKCLD